jgi:hypothetical protein
MREKMNDCLFDKMLYQIPSDIEERRIKVKQDGDPY